MPQNEDDFNFSWDQPTQAAGAQASQDPAMPDQGFDAPAAAAPSAPATPQHGLPQPSMQPSSVDPLANTPSAAGQGDQANPYAEHVTALSSASTDEDRALARNNLMRTLYSDFQAAGHDVAWEGEQLVVDGLPYEVAGATPSSVNPADISAAAGHGVVGPQTSQAAVPTTAPPGFEQSKWNDQAHQSPKYIAGRIIASGGSVQDVATALGAEVRGGDKIWRADLGLVDIIQDAGPGGLNAPAWFPQDVDANGNIIPPNFGGGPAAGAGAMSVGTGGPAIPGMSALPPVTPYNFSYDGLMEQDGIDQQVEHNLSELLAHPESMDAHTVDVMKAKAKNELTDAQQQEEADILSLGYQGGIGESPWTQGQRLNSRFNRDIALSNSNTNVDIQAAQSRMSDQRAAIDEGLKYAAQKQDRRQFAELAKQRATELGISEQQVVAQYTLGILDAELKKYGMNLDAELAKEGFQIDWAKIDQANTQFLMDLGFKYSSLEENASQFDASH